jgi:hypothetical protein
LDLKFVSDVIYENNLDTLKFAQMLDDPSQCYKFYWMEAVVNLARDSEDDFSFEKVIDEMICEAWYSVTQYYLRLGPTIKGITENFLEHAINTIQDKTDLPLNATKDQIMRAIAECSQEIKDDKSKLTNYVPYRLLSSFLDAEGMSLLDRRAYKRLIAYMEMINETQNLFYTVIDGRGLQKKVHISKQWRQLLKDNYLVITSWIQLNKIRFLQDRNPGVPSIIYKLSMESERKLLCARELWKMTTQITGKPLHDIYTGDDLEISRFDLDHFVPRSYIANDELWNLTPIDKQLNSSKNNRLPNWDTYFERFSNNLYFLYGCIFSNNAMRLKFEDCRRDNLNAIWATETLFISGNTKVRFKNILSYNMLPVYEAAKLQGYGEWKLQKI